MITINDISNIKPKFYRDLPNTGLGRRFKTQVYQEEFLSELDPAGHKINNPITYENIMKRVPATDAMGNEIKECNTQDDVYLCYKILIEVATLHHHKKFHLCFVLLK